jgi:hypothetical protein
MERIRRDRQVNRAQPRFKRGVREGTAGRFEQHPARGAILHLSRFCSLRRFISASSIVTSAGLVRAQTLPRPTSEVSDLADVLTSATRDDLESLLTTLEKDTGAVAGPRVY